VSRLRLVLRIGVLSFALVFPTFLTWAYFVRADAGAIQILYGAGKVFQFSIPILFWLDSDPSQLRLASARRRGVAVGIAFGLLVAAGIFAIYFGYLKNQPLTAALAEQVWKKVAGFGLASPSRFLIFAFFLSLIHAGLEEYYWRAFLFAGWRKLTSLPWAIVISSFGFMAHHVVVLNEYFPGRFWTTTMPFSLAVACGGAVWAWMYDRYNSIHPTWASHALVDAAIMLVGWQLLFGR
jgi:membrane protease YdiL (CAAX protease family)